MNIFCDDPCIACDPIPLGAEGIFPNPNSEANPFINFSSEAPDVDLFIKFRYGPTGPTIGIPPLGNPWTASGCVGICFSPISQADADRCAYNQSVLCTPGIWPENPDAAACLLDPDACRPVPPPTFFNTVQSCTAFCPDGSPFTFTVAGGQYAALSQASANAIALSQACNQAQLRKICLSSLPGGCVGEPYNAVISGSTSEPSLVFSLVAGSLPSGTVLSQGGPKTVTIAGTPDAVGPYVFTIRATAPSGAFTTKQYSISVASITTSSPLPDGDVGQPYSYTLVGSGNTGTVHWFVSGGQLPDGLSLNELTGEISGTPTTEEAQSFTVEMRDDAADCLKEFDLSVNPADTACSFFSDLVWGVPDILNAGSGAFVANVFSVSASGDGPPDPIPGEISNDGTVSYEGPEIQCCILITGNVAQQFGETSQILITHSDFGLLANYQENTSGSQTFTIPETFAPATITVHVECSAGGGDIPEGAYSISLAATIGACP